MNGFSETEKKQLVSAFLLDKMVNEGIKIQNNGENGFSDFEPFLRFMLHENVIQEEEEFYRVTEKGKTVLIRFLTIYQNYFMHFDIFSYVDIDRREFAFEKYLEYDNNKLWSEYLDKDCWDDLRLAVCQYKNINPRMMIFMSYFCEGDLDIFFESNPVVFHDELWKEIDEIAEVPLKLSDSSDVNKNGDSLKARQMTETEGYIAQDILKDFIKKGAEINLHIKKHVDQAPEADDFTVHPGENSDTDHEEADGVKEDHDYGYVAPPPERYSEFEKYLDPSYCTPCWKKSFWSK